MEPTATRPSRSSSSASRKSNLSLDLSNLPPLQPPTPPSNTLLLTNLDNVAIFTPDNLATIRNLISASAFIHAFAPLKSFRRIVVSFFDVESAIKVRKLWDGEMILGEKCKIYFGMDTPIKTKDEHLALPDAGKLFFISPPPSPPHGWEMKMEDAPNKLVHADDLAAALSKLHHHAPPQADDTPVHESPLTPDGGAPRMRSRSSTLIYQPEQKDSPHMPAVVVEDMTDDLELKDEKPILAHTARPPVELMHDA
ncbi:Calcipressin-domain-containing protein [Emericellopsis atlantica]|uniref:Calcipressin-domain-containing protein n=1 Tax=Emericellopsis atlantica TaxID=2614577 RepID=A0A9P7ZRK7_9HYPO|nr:Calcipressin-domain-containing protein [Emericellopsis atlantica]KAG9256400.1 Calcipressin-domain-containing protein [Emericellopsis atlantica]